MKFNYFNNSQSNKWLLKSTRAFTELMLKTAPTLTTRLGHAVFLKPHGKRAYTLPDHLTFETHQVDTLLGTIQLNVFGKGDKLILMSHGWADHSGGFVDMTTELVKQGFCVATIDHVAHGRSSGKQAHLLSFIDSIKQSLHYFEEQGKKVEGIIAHSMGAIATMNLDEAMLSGRKVILIAAPINFFELMFERVEKSGISAKLLSTVLDNIAQRYNHSWQSLCMHQNRHKLNEDILFIHDEFDRYACYQSLTTYLEGTRSPLFSTQGLGHRKVLGDTHVIEHIKQVMTS